MDLVIVPLWRRAGFAEACLRQLRRAMDGGVRVILSVDCGHDEETLAVAKRFVHGHPGRAQLAVRNVDYPTGSYNVFTAMREALDWVGTEDLVHVLEEDILIGQGYFAYHRRAHALVPSAYSVSGCENLFLPDDWKMPDLPDAVYLSGAFQVWGSSYRPGRVEKILSRLRPGYFEDMGRAMTAEFGEANMLRTGPLYDGVMANDMAQQGLHVAFPFTPRAYHAGFEGLSYGDMALSGSPEEQADAILEMSGEELKARCTLPGARFRPVDLDRTPGAVRRVVAL
ncbi:glycosyltransferase [Streptomyces cucumeris]|uniref:glycosyltransferase n=1 Tax=Streptomyces cucumeris TaxID=2962890 RepID=UPI0020C85CF2|nr:glycosyltransferase [Streptomyces sp. NEAU-Y11]MCP9209652.1 glycosyltransferase [Streptomyces sp. NEAU-Y11]